LAQWPDVRASFIDLTRPARQEEILLRTILVPLDGTELAASILQDARRMAGRGGEIILVRDLRWTGDRSRTKSIARWDNEAGDPYLERQADMLREQGVRVAIRRALLDHPAEVVDGLAGSLQVSMIACATHGRGPLGRLVHGGIAWKMLAHSPVPVLLRHPSEEPADVAGSSEPVERRILVPLDGSTFAETALPLAQQLASEWNCSIVVVRAMASSAHAEVAYLNWGITPYNGSDTIESAQEYLDRQVDALSGSAYSAVLPGSSTSELLVEAVDDYDVTDVVMSTHGRTGISRAVVGSVADALIQHLHCPIILVPSLVAQAVLAPPREHLVTV
jgi:nucleotide-binding universal stress UspA family protein